MTARGAVMARWLAVFGLLLHMAVPMAHTPPALIAALASAHAAHAADMAGHSVHRHRGDMHAAADQKPPRPATPGHDRPMQCPICQALHLGGPALVPTTFVFLTLEVSHALFAPSLSDFAAGRFDSPLQARAPPATG